MRKSYWQLGIIGIVLTVICATRPALAQDRDSLFLRGLQDADYGDLAVDYLKMLKDAQRLPDGLRDTYDLEMSKSLRAAAKLAYDAAEFDKTMAEAQQFLDKFIKEKPSHPEAVSALLTSGNFTVDKALQKMREERLLPKEDKANKEKLLADARQLLTSAKPRFEQAEKKYHDRYKQLPPAPRREAGKVMSRADKAILAERENVYAGWLDSQFQIGLTEYYVAQTYSNLKDPARIQILKGAAKRFDDIWQRNRVNEANQVNISGLYAHMWHGKVMEETGDLVTANDIYEEVLANEGMPGLEPLFAQVQFFRMLNMSKKAHPLDFVNEASQWLREGEKTYRSFDGYQGVALELVKKLLQLAEKASGGEKTKLTTEANTLLADMARVRSSYQQEAILLRRQLSGGASEASQINNFEEAVTMAQAAEKSGDWPNASAAWKRAMELSSKVTNKKRVEEVRVLAGANRLLMAELTLNDGKTEDAEKEFVALSKEFAEAPWAARVGVLGVNVALRKFAATTTPANLKALEEAVQNVINAWGSRPEADDARAALGQARLQLGQMDEAMDIFNKINPKSERYPAAQYFLSMIYWRKYVMGKNKPADQQDKDQITADRKKAMEMGEAAVKAMQKAQDPKRPMSPLLAKAQLFLGQIKVDFNEYDEAVKLLAPLVADVVKAKAEAEPTNMPIFILAVRAYVGAGDMDNAQKVSLALINSGADTAQANRALIEFARQLNVEKQKADAEVIKAKSDKNDKALKTAEARAAKTNDFFRSLITKLSERKELSTADKVFLADSCGTLGITEQAKTIYNGVLADIRKAGDDDPIKKAEPRVLTQLVGLLRTEGEAKKSAETLRDALEKARDLRKQRAKSLEPWMEEGRILQSIAQITDQPDDWQAAVKLWSQLRNMLATIRKPPGELFEVTYNVSESLFRLGKVEKDKDKRAKTWTDAEKVLKAPLILTPSLNGPDTVAKYEALLAEIAEAKK